MTYRVEFNLYCTSILADSPLIVFSLRYLQQLTVCKLCGEHHVKRSCFEQYADLICSHHSQAIEIKMVGCLYYNHRRANICAMGEFHKLHYKNLPYYFRPCSCHSCGLSATILHKCMTYCFQSISKPCREASIAELSATKIKLLSETTILTSSG